MTDSEKVTLVSSDNESFEVDQAVAEESETIKNLLADTSDDSMVPLMNVRGSILSKVITYCKYQVEARETDDQGRVRKTADEIKRFKKDFVDVEKSVLFELILAANYLNIKDLLEDTCQAVADMIKGKSAEEIRREFNIENDFTPEEEEEIRRENQWAFD